MPNRIESIIKPTVEDMKPLIGVEYLPVNGVPVINRRQQWITKVLASKPPLRQAVTHSLNNNTPRHGGLLATERPVSAYFSYNPQEQQLTIEWGEINPHGEAKLHDYLNEHINHRERAKMGMTIRSGHIARFIGSPKKIALIDALLGNSPVKKEMSEWSIVTALLKSDITPVGGDGFVQIPEGAVYED